MAPAFPHVVASSQQVWKLIEKDYTLRLSLVANGWATEHLKAWNAVFAEGRKRGNSAYYGTALVDMEIADMDKRAQWACDIFGEIWEIQGRKKCRPFFRAVFDQGINPMLSIREGCFRHELELHLKRTGRGLSPDLSAVMGSMKRHTAQLRAKWNTKLEIAARDAESQESLAREQETGIVLAHTPSMGGTTSDLGRTNDSPWQQLSNAFAKLVEEEKGKRCLGVMATQELNHSGEVAVWTINDSYSDNFKARFELLASQAGKSLGPLPDGSTPFSYWLHRLYQHLREERSSLSRFQIYTAKTDAGNQVSLECPLIESACEASSTFCLRLQKREIDTGHEGKEISVCFQDWIENNVVSVSIPAEISERNSVSLVAKSAQISIPIVFLSSCLQEIRSLRGNTVSGSPRNFLDEVAETHGLIWVITRHGLWMAQKPPSAGVYIDANGMPFGESGLNQGKFSTSSVGSDQSHKETIWTKMWSWGVIGTIDVSVLSTGVAFMTSGHPQATDIVLSAGTLLFVAKFWTWEEARRQPMWKRWRLQVGAMLLSCSVCICALFWNHAINRAASFEQSKPAPPQAQPAQPAVPTIDNQPKRSATIADEITALLSEQLQVDKSEIKPEKDLVLGLGATPLDKTEIVMQIETAYNIQISSKDARKLKSVGDIINYVERRDHTGKTSTSVALLGQSSVSSNAKTVQAPTYEQKCETSACAQGPGSQATFNQYGPAKLTMTQEQQAAVTKAMLPYAGLEFTIERHDATKDSSEYGDKIRDALKAAGIFCARDSTGSRIQPGGISAGVSVIIGRGNLDELKALAKALRTSGAIVGKVSYVTDRGRQNAFDILVAPNH